MSCRQKAISTFILIMAVIGLYLMPGLASAQISDSDVTIAVESQILKDPGTNLNNIDVVTADGIVTLSGTVNNILAKDRAAKVAQTVKGVRSVIDRITIKTLSRPDKDIKENIEQALIFDPLSESWETDVTVDDGKVTLYGTVDSWAEREIIGRIAKGVKGVRDFENNIGVVYKTERPDSEIMEDIDRRLYWDALVDDSLIDVTVNNGNVMLTGTVGSAAERVQAHRDSWVAGTKTVDSSGLEVKWWARDEQLRRDKYAARPDDLIRQAIEDAFLYDPRVNKYDILVFVDDGRVTLWGKVNNLRAKRAAGQEARNTVGVWSVRNLIKVRPSTPTDQQIANNIRDAFVMDPYVSRFEINISVIDGAVYLNGAVDNYFEKAQADYLASGIYGVTEIHNRLKVENNNVLTYNPYVDEWYTYDYDWYLYPYTFPVKTDADIRREINDELFWSPFVDADDVTVTVDDGVATLSGKVDSMGEYRAAVENALEGGAIMVDNELELKNRTE